MLNVLIWLGLSVMAIAILGLGAWLLRGKIPPDEFSDLDADGLDDDDREYLRRWTKH